MAEPILDPLYWRKRLDEATNLHHAIFRCPLETWQKIEEKHRQILAATIKPGDSVLDCGCGWGRLLDLMPTIGPYVGIDLSPDFIRMAQQRHKRRFHVEDLREISHETLGLLPHFQFDWAIFLSIRPMVRRNLGDEVWAKIEANVRKVAKRLLLLEYDPLDPGSIE